MSKRKSRVPFTWDSCCPGSKRAFPNVATAERHIVSLTAAGKATSARWYVCDGGGIHITSQTENEREQRLADCGTGAAA